MANLFSNPWFMHGASTSCNADVFVYSAAQVKKPWKLPKSWAAKTTCFGAAEKDMKLVQARRHFLRTRGRHGQLCQRASKRHIVDERYSSFEEGIGKEISEGKTDFKSLEKYALGLKFIDNASGIQEYLEAILNDYITSVEKSFNVCH